MAPSPFQMVLFLYESEMILATPLPVPLAKALHHILGYWVGQRLLGFVLESAEYGRVADFSLSRYDTSYEEYWPQRRNL